MLLLIATLVLFALAGWAGITYAKHALWRGLLVAVLPLIGIGVVSATGNVLLLRADWTSRDPEITAVLSSFGRSGVPLYVIYPSSSAATTTEILPAVLTPGLVLDAISRATASANALR